MAWGLCSTSFALRALSTCVCVSNSTCLRADPENSNIGSVNKSQAPSKKKPDGGLSEIAYSSTQRNTKASPFPSRRVRVHSKHEGANMKCKPKCAPGGTLSKTTLASCSGRYWQDPLASSDGILGRIHWRDTRRDPLASYFGRLRKILGGIHWRAAMVGYLASSGEILGGIHWPAALAGYSGDWRDTRRDPLASSSGGILGGIHWRAALAGYWVGA